MCILLDFIFNESQELHISRFFFIRYAVRKFFQFFLYDITNIRIQILFRSYTANFGNIFALHTNSRSWNIRLPIFIIRIINIKVAIFQLGLGGRFTGCAPTSSMTLKRINEHHMVTSLAIFYPFALCVSESGFRSWSYLIYCESIQLRKILTSKILFKFQISFGWHLSSVLFLNCVQNIRQCFTVYIWKWFHGTFRSFRKLFLLLIVFAHSQNTPKSIIFQPIWIDRIIRRKVVNPLVKRSFLIGNDYFSQLLA